MKKRGQFFDKCVGFGSDEASTMTSKSFESFESQLPPTLAILSFRNDE